MIYVWALYALFYIHLVVLTDFLVHLRLYEWADG